jgi:hypothetical protein
VGQIDALAGVFIQTGSVIASSGERMVSGLVWRLGSLSFVTDNAGCFGGQPFPWNGRIISFGSHELYVGTERACRYPEQVLVAADPPSHMLDHAGRSARPVESAEVTMTGPAASPAGGAGKGVAADVPPEPERTKRSARPPLERAKNLAGTFGMSARDQPLIPIINRLLEPVQSGDDPEQAKEILEEQRQALVDWMDFEVQFVSDFTSTYKRPNRPQQLANCRQGDYEPDHDYLTRWCTMCNSCEGVVETHAIMWFAQGCRHGTMLWQRLQRDMSATLADTIKIVDSYALGDPMQPTLASSGQGQSQWNNSGAGTSGQLYCPYNRNKRRDDRLDYRYGSSKVAAVEQEQAGAGSS